MRRYLVLFAVCIYSTFSIAQNVGIGVNNPQNKLHIGGGLRLDTLTGVNGAGLLKHDANGVMYGIKFSANANDVLRGDGTFGPYNPAINGALGWLLNGNSGTNPATHFLGTVDNVPFNIRVNNLRSGSIEPTSGNTSWGYQTLLSNTTGTRNTAVGYEVLSKNIFGRDNTALGHAALTKTVGNSFYTHYGSENTAIGSASLSNNTSGFGNTANGYKTLELTTTGYQNSAFGLNALRNTTASNNSAFGAYALYDNLGGYLNNSFGSYSLINNTSGSGNSAFGYSALSSNSTGYENTAIGNFSLYNNNSYYNSAFGANSLNGNTSGHDNTALGYSALYKSTAASFNTSVGAFSLYNSKGNSNTAVGYKSMEQNGFGVANTAVGLGALQSNIDGYSNSAFGNQALANNLYGANNTAIGTYAGFGLPSNVNNVIVIGVNTGWNTTSSNQVNIGNFSATWIGGQVGWFHYSDKRIKNDIKDDVPGLAFIIRLKPITYHVDVDKQEEIANAGYKEFNSELMNPFKKDVEGKYDVEKIKMSGFFAQDVEEVSKEINYSFNGVHNPKNGGLLSLDYSAFVVPLVKAVQEQQKIIEDQNKKIDKQQQQIDLLIKEMQSLKKDLITQNN
jgi:hypothetical protein